jgi:hypothetical protein
VENAKPFIGFAPYLSPVGADLWALCLPIYLKNLSYFRVYRIPVQAQDASSRSSTRPMPNPGILCAMRWKLSVQNMETAG